VIEQKLLELFTQAQTGIQKIAPDVYKLALLHEHWSGIGQIAIGAFFLLLFLIMGVTYLRMARDTDWAKVGDGSGFPVCVIPGVAGFGLPARCFHPAPQYLELGRHLPATGRSRP
jgi:hypothetical protein